MGQRPQRNLREWESRHHGDIGETHRVDREKDITNYESCVRHSRVVGVYANCRLVCLLGHGGVECVDGSTNETVEDLLVLLYLTEEIYRYIYMK